MVEIDTPEIRIALLSQCTRFCLRIRADAAARIRRVADYRLDLPVNRLTGTDDRCSVRLGPDEWLLLSGAPDDAAAIEAALSDEAHSLVDISHRNAAFAVSGGRAREVLNGGCPLDLDDRAFPAGMGTRTLFGKAEVVLLCSGSPSGFRLECARSFAPYVAALLELNAREFAGN